MKKKRTSPDPKGPDGPSKAPVQVTKQGISKAKPYFVDTSTPKRKAAGA
jgi:hypothetical protein